LDATLSVFSAKLPSRNGSVASEPERTEISFSEENGEAIAVGSGELECVGDIFDAHCF
jgi:hypothetical protein